MNEAHIDLVMDDFQVLITIQNAVVTRPGGEYVKTWETFATVKAQVQMAGSLRYSGKKVYASRQPLADQGYYIWFPYTAGIDETMQVLLPSGGRPLFIHAVYDIHDREFLTVLNCNSTPRP